MKSVFALVALILTGTIVAAATTQPYAGQDGRDIATLTEKDIDDLLAGRGWGFALSAELNGYPGPTHVLEMAEDLELSADQISRIEEIKTEMAAKAQDLGTEFIAAEAELDAAFEEGAITTETLATLTDAAASIEAELRKIHLGAHLDVTPLLSRHQIVTYNRMRGYGSATEGGHGGH